MDQSGAGRGRSHADCNVAGQYGGVCSKNGKDGVGGPNAECEMGREPRRLKDILEQGQFAVTVEYNPPKGTNINGLLDNAKQLLGRVHGVNVTYNTAAVVRAGALPVCRLLYELGHDPVMQLTCRDRNRIAMQSDLVDAHMLGIRNVLCLT